MVMIMLESIKELKHMSFLYDQKPFEGSVISKKELSCGSELTTVYDLDKGLRVTSTLRLFEEFDACEIVNRFENLSNEPTGLITELWDCQVTLPLAHEEERRWTAFMPDPETATRIYAPTGSDWSSFEFYSDPYSVASNNFTGSIFAGQSRRYANRGGRSSQGAAPFFNIHKNGEGYIYAVGWTGQWNFEVLRGSDDVTMHSKLEDTSFRLLPGESFRTSSAVIMAYKGDFIEAQNKWRRLVKQHFSLIGSDGRDKYGPLSANIWGGMTTDEAVKRVEIIKNNSIPFTHVWMDAGWYGESTRPTPNEFEGDWSNHTGDWTVSPLIHTNDLKDFSRAVHDGNMKLILWFEPERVVSSTPIVSSHPEYFLSNGADKPQSLLLDLGNDDAWNYIFETLSKMIEDIGVDCYRQDFNFDPLDIWRHNDLPDRKGMTEIKHINGMYRLWDSLLERFPHLIIDNCASGGRRIDIETLRRSMPLWRSDLECPANFPSRCIQSHHLTFNLWMPYSGSGCGRIHDTYRIRSSYDSSLATNFTYSQTDAFGDSPEQLEWLKSRAEEFLVLRPYFCEDFYPLTSPTDRSDAWSAAQFDRPSEKDGIVQIFRREGSPITECEFVLRGLDPERIYLFTDIDAPESSFELSGNLLRVRMEEQHSSRIYIYRQK